MLLTELLGVEASMTAVEHHSTHDVENQSFVHKIRRFVLFNRGKGICLCVADNVAKILDLRRIGPFIHTRVEAQPNIA